MNESGVCAIAAFSDDDMNRLLNVDGENQFVIYIATVGKPECGVRNAELNVENPPDRSGLRNVFGAEVG